MWVEVDLKKKKGYLFTILINDNSIVITRVDHV